MPEDNPYNVEEDFARQSRYEALMSVDPNDDPELFDYTNQAREDMISSFPENEQVEIRRELAMVRGEISREEEIDSKIDSNVGLSRMADFARDMVDDGYTQEEVARTLAINFFGNSPEERAAAEPLTERIALQVAMDWIRNPERREVYSEAKVERMLTGFEKENVMPTDITTQQVLRQLEAMHHDVFEVGIGIPKDSPQRYTGDPFMIRTWDRDSIVKSIPYLKAMNATGRDIYIRPDAAADARHSLTMLDDLSRDALTTMMRTGYQPSVVVETSPNNFQAWLDHGQVLDHQRSTLAAKELAQRFGADKGAADYRHFGRLAGFTNQKGKHIDTATGLHPYVKLPLAVHRVYDRAPDVLQGVEQTLTTLRKKEMEFAERYRQHGHDINKGDLKSIDDFRKDPRYGGDHSREDYAFACYAAGFAGLAKDEARRQLASRDGLSKKHPNAEKYLDNTVNKAYDNALGRGIGR